MRTWDLRPVCAWHGYVFVASWSTATPPFLSLSYGQFFLKWYSQSLIAHGDAVLATAAKAFPGSSLAAKVAGESPLDQPPTAPSVLALVPPYPHGTDVCHVHRLRPW